MNAFPQVFGGRLAPLTDAIGFVEAPVEAITKALRISHHPTKFSDLDETLERALLRLEPLGGGERFLLWKTSSRWTAWFANDQTGFHEQFPLARLAREMGSRAVHITAIPDTYRADKPGGRYGALKLSLYGLDPPQVLRYEADREIALVNDGGRWTFSAEGPPEDFERQEIYAAKRVIDRFSSEILLQYSSAIGIRPFDSDFYGSMGRLVEPRSLAYSALTRVLPGPSIRDAQHALGIKV